jgi:hypothetical protein
VARPLTIRQLKRIYTRLRRQYYFIGPGEYDSREVPPADALAWRWFRDGAEGGAIAITSFDEDGDPEEVAFNRKYARSPILMTANVAHEMSHMRLGPKHDCSRTGKSPAWDREVERLARLGFLREVL